MADPISLVGLTAGLVSLGLQLSKGIYEYIDALKCRDEEIASARQQADSLKGLIQAVQTASQDFQQGQPVTTASVSNCINSCKTELAALENLLLELRGQNQAASGLRSNLKSHSRRLVYVFDRPKIEKLETRLDRANNKLALILQTLGIEISATKGGLSKLESSISSLDVKFSNETQGLKQQIEDAKDSQGGHHAQLSGQIAAVEIKISNESQGLKQQLQDNKDSQDAYNVQMRNEVAAILQTQLCGFDELSAIRRKITRHEKWFKQLQHNQQEVVYRPVSHFKVLAKPALLKEICDTTNVKTNLKKTVSAITHLGAPSDQDQFQALMLSLGVTTTCLCRPRRQLKRKTVTQGMFDFFSEITTVEQHFAGCPTGRKTGTEQKQEYGLVYNGLRRILNSAIRISLATHTGAGAWSISPTFAYCPTVDELQAPAFRIISTLSSAASFVGYHPAGYDSMPQWNQFVALALTKLTNQLRHQKLSPRAVDDKNQSLAHYAAEAIAHAAQIGYHPAVIKKSNILKPLLQVFQTLVSYGVPATNYNINGKAPLGFAFSQLTRSRLALVELTNIIFPTADAVMPVTCGSSYDLRLYHMDMANHLKALGSSPKIAEACGCGPLSLAVLANDLVQVERLLKHHPDMLYERNLYDEGPLHMACDKPDCLKLILGHNDLKVLNQLDFCGHSALEWALVLSSDSCKNGRADRMCSHCTCAATTVLLLKAGAPFNNRFYKHLQKLIDSASYRCKIKLIRHLKTRRDALKNLALDYLLVSEIHKLGIQNEKVLDAALPGVVSLLQSRGVPIPPVLYPPLDDWGIYPVYKVLRRPKDADLFFRLGFRDTYIQGPWDDYFNGCDLVYLQWLDQHGADLIFKPLDSQVGSLFGAHILCSKFGDLATVNRLYSALPLDEDWVCKLNTAAISNEMADDCQCKCSIAGCVPFIYLLKRLNTYYTNDFKVVAHLVVACIEEYGAGVGLVHHSAALRYLTYGALEIPHTCCGSKWRFCERYSENYVREIQSEHAYSLALLEELVKELGEQLSAIFSGSEDQINPKLFEFWEYTWVERMAQTVQQLEGDELSEEERLEAAKIGVVWEESSQPEGPEEFETTDKEENPHDFKTWEYWFYELDQIPE